MWLIVIVALLFQVFCKGCYHYFLICVGFKGLGLLRNEMFCNIEYSGDIFLVHALVCVQDVGNWSSGGGFPSSVLMKLDVKSITFGLRSLKCEVIVMINDLQNQKTVYPVCILQCLDLNHLFKLSCVK